MANAKENLNKWLAFEYLDAELRAETEKAAKNETAVEECFGSELEFGTGGMRGILGAGIGRMNLYTVRRASAGFAAYMLSSIEGSRTAGVVISHDNRHHSRDFALATAGVFAAYGIKAYIFDALRPTPELSFAVRRLSAAGGVMITASHNPPEYNGYKIYDREGCQLNLDDTDRVIAEIAKIENELTVPCLTPEEAGDLIVTLDASMDEAYYEAVKSISLENVNASALKVVYSPQHGTGNIPVRRVLGDIGYDLLPVESQCDPDPDFSGTESPNPENKGAYTEALKLARHEVADIIITTDPDCDRLGVVARKNGLLELMTGNQSGAVLIQYILDRLQSQGCLPENAVMINTIVTSDLGDKICENYGVSVEKTLTGFKFIGEKIAEHKARGDKSYVFGYEESYGCLIGDFARDKDGVQACLMLCEAAAYYKAMGITLWDVLDNIYDIYGFYLDTQSNFYFKGIGGKEKIAAITEGLRNTPIAEVGGVAVTTVEDYMSEEYHEKGFPYSDVLRYLFADGCWVAVRPSGTEPKIKFYYCVRAADKAAADARLSELRAAFEPELD